MKPDLSYRFKPTMKGLNSGMILNLLLIGGAIYFFFKFLKDGTAFLNQFSKGSDTQQKEGDAVKKEVEKSQLPDVDLSKMNDRITRLENLLYTLFRVDNEGIYNLLSDLSAPELNWIYLKWGVREYKHGLLSEKENQNLFGFFDKQVSDSYKKKLETLFSKCTFKYKMA